MVNGGGAASHAPPIWLIEARTKRIERYNRVRAECEQTVAESKAALDKTYRRLNYWFFRIGIAVCCCSPACFYFARDFVAALALILLAVIVLLAGTCTIARRADEAHYWSRLRARARKNRHMFSVIRDR